jgi:hypothetical protein
MNILDGTTGRVAEVLLALLRYLENWTYDHH